MSKEPKTVDDLMRFIVRDLTNEDGTHDSYAGKKKGWAFAAHGCFLPPELIDVAFRHCGVEPILDSAWGGKYDPLKVIRQQLAYNFPGVKFSVKKNGNGVDVRYPGNSIIKVGEQEWNHTAAASRERRQVERIVKQTKLDGPTFVERW